MMRTKKTLFDMTRILLVRPQGSQNIGACCRAMKNMDFTQLYIIKGIEINKSDVKTFALSAFNIFENALFFNNMEEALADSSLVIGTTRRTGKRRIYFSLFPEEMAKRILLRNNWPVTLVFGNEESGLTQEELNFCHYAVKIPTSDEFPSMNLSHAVQVLLYVFARCFRKAELTPVKSISQQDLQPIINHILDDLQNIGFFKISGREDMEIYLRDICSRAGLSIREARQFKAMFQKIKGLKQSKNK